MAELPRAPQQRRGERAELHRRAQVRSAGPLPHRRPRDRRLRQRRHRDRRVRGALNMPQPANMSAFPKADTRVATQEAVVENLRKLVDAWRGFPLGAARDAWPEDPARYEPMQP